MNSAPIVSAWAIPSGAGCVAYSIESPHCLPSLSSRLNNGCLQELLLSAPRLYLWGSKTAYKPLNCGFACDVGRRAGSIAGL